ncbi:prepilin peptidase [Microlunatus speluncae]|uniref:prepilin peptidase n=1 Tax=Microlunatus speluncae TaxID=2594267 RepID=UPI00126673E6|nr:prepilin peptidase [Microlunatus speluncae]
MPDPLVTALLIMLAAATVGAGLPIVLRLLPEPLPEPAVEADAASGPERDADDHPAWSAARDEPAKIRYADLVRPGFIAGCVVAAAGAAAIGLFWLPRELSAVWLVLAVFGVSLAAIDGATTWLPMRLSYAGWLAMAIATVATAFAIADGGWLLRTVAGAAIAGAVYLAIWAFSRGGFGFGDVRFAPLLGAAAAADSWTLLLWGLLSGALLGGAFGLARILTGRRGGFPYAPSMLIGVYLAVLLTRLAPFG